MNSILELVKKTPRAWQVFLPIVVLAFYGGLANAQSDEETSDEVTESDGIESDGIEEITVTGSRVVRDTFSSISPLQVIDGEVARDLGLIDTADLLRQTTVVQGTQFTTGLSTSGGILTDSGPGSSTASLRGLDAGRTLVLVNGRRLAPAGVGGAPSAPDLNLVPGSLVDRVDVLLDGASSVYGSDAVAGVVNVILKSDFDGLQLDWYRSSTGLENNGGDQQVISATWGVNDDRGFMGFAAEYSYIDGFRERDLAKFYQPYAGDCRSGYTQGASGDLYESCAGSFGAGSALTGFGFFGFDGTSQVAGMPPGFFQIGVTADLLTPGSVNGAALLLWPEELDAAMAPDFKRTTLFSVGEYSPGWPGDATVYYEASWAARETTTNTSGQGVVELPGDYPFGSFGGLAATLFFNDNFTRNTEVSQTRVTAGIKGDLNWGNLSNWSYDTYANYSRSTGTDRLNGISFFPRLEQTLSNTRLDVASGEIVCDPRVIPGEGQQTTCRPLDFFDPTFILTGRFPDPDDNAYLFPNRLSNTIVEQTTVQGFVTGELFDIPWGDSVNVVLGFEYREDSIGTDTGLTGEFHGFSADPGSNGSRSLRESFIELDMPLVLDRPGVRELSLNLAGRQTDEDNFGSESTYRVQAQWAPVDWFRFRGTQGTSFRAPNLGEQFGGAVTGFSNPSDPCRPSSLFMPFIDHDNDPNTPVQRVYDPSLDTREQTVIDNCLNGGGPFGLEATNPFALGVRGLDGTNPSFLGSPTLVASGSNPELRAETSTAQTFGFVFEQPWSDRFDLSFSATWFDIVIDDEVDQLSAITIVNRCYNSPGLVDPTCTFITRDPRDEADDTSGDISFVSALNQNLGQQVAEGIDYNLDFNMDFSAVNWNMVVRATQSKTQTEEEFRATEVFLNDNLNEFGNPEWRLSVTNIFAWRDWSFLWQYRYIDSMIEDNEDIADQDDTSSFFNPCVQAGDTFTGHPAIDDGRCVIFDDVGSYKVHDVSAAWRGDSMTVRLGVTNVLDDAPPITNNNSLFSTTSNGAGVGGVGYDLRGRTFFLNVTAGF